MPGVRYQSGGFRTSRRRGKSFNVQHVSAVLPKGLNVLLLVDGDTWSLQSQSQLPAMHEHGMSMPLPRKVDRISALAGVSGVKEEALVPQLTPMYHS